MPETAPSFNYANVLPPELPEQGFHVEMLPFTPEKIPLRDVLASREETDEAYRRRLENGDGLRILGPNEAPAEGETVVQLLSPEVHLSGEQYDSVVQPEEGHRRPGLLSEPQAQKIGLWHKFPDLEEEAVRQSALKPYVPATVSDVDYARLGTEILNNVDGVSQLFEIASGDKKVRLYNFGDTPLTEDDMKRVSNAIRHSSDLSGGKIFDNLGVMAVLSKDDPMWEGGDVNASTGSVQGGVVILSEKLFEPGEEERRNALKPQDNPHSVSAGIEATVFHELQHVLAVGAVGRAALNEFGKAVGWEETNVPDNKNPGKFMHVHTGEHKHPFSYGQSAREEDLPETAAALHLGGDWEAYVDKDRRAATRQFWQTVHSGVQGPTFVRTREVDLRSLPGKLGTNIERPIAFRAANYLYVIDQEPAVEQAA